MTHDPRLASAVAARHATLDPRILAWVGTDVAREHLRSELLAQVERIDDLVLARAFQQACPIPGAAAEAYRNAWLDLPGGGWALVGIRFRGLDRARPFVDLVATDRPLDASGTVQRLARAGAEHYAVFGPRHLRLLVPAHGDAWRGALEGAFVERYVLAAPVDALLREPAPDGRDSLTLRPLAVPEGGRRVRAAYAQLAALDPRHPEYASPASDEELAAWSAEGLAFEAFVDGVPIGAVAAFRATTFGMAGFCVGEIVAYPERRGTGLGPALLRALIDVLPAEPNDVLFGEIDHRNRPAVRTAERSGRVEVGRYVWVPSPG